jgi:CobQ/CobB/MinD/ParA nucleotide binding domain
VRLVQQNVNTDLRLTGIVMTMFDPRTKLSEQVVAEVRRYFGDRVYRTIIPRTVRLSEAPGFGQPITVYDPHSKGAESYRDLAHEVAARLPDESPLPNVDDVPSVVIPRPEAPPGRAPRPLIGPEDRPPGRSEPVARVAADEDLPAMPDPVVEPDADPTDDAPGEPPLVAPPRPIEPPGAVEASAGGQAVSHPPAESSPSVDQGSRDVVEEPMDLNGDRTQAEPEDEMQLDRGGSIDPGGEKRRRGLFRRGGT